MAESESMTSGTAPAPPIIRVFAWLLIVGAFATALNNLLVGGRLVMGGQVSLARLSWSLLAKLGMVVCGIGFLRMRTWAPFLYFALAALTLATIHLLPINEYTLELYSRSWSLVAAVAVPALVAMMVLRYRRQFS